MLLTGTYSAPAGGVALSILMLPTVVLTAEEAIKMVPTRMTDAAIGMGCTRSQVVWKSLLPTAHAGHPDRRDAGGRPRRRGTAPLLFTALFSNYWLFEGGQPKLMQPTASLAVLIYNFSGMPFENQIELAWAASLVLVLLVLVINIASRLVSQRRSVSRRGRNARCRLSTTAGELPSQHRATARADNRTAVVIDCKIDKIYYGSSWPCATATCRSRRARSPASSARRAAARARCCAASTA